VLDANRGRQVQYEVRYEAEAAYVFEPPAAVELVRHRDLVDALLAIPQRTAGLVGPGVGLAEEVTCFQNRRDLMYRLGVDHQRGHDRFFGLNIVWWQLLEHLFNSVVRLVVNERLSALE